jgi:CubicO group peptidase (beta-lactamase class C family)
MLIRPLELDNTVTLPEDALLRRAAVGHLSHAGVAAEPAQRWQFPRSIGPGGLINASAADVLAFARLHLTGGITAHGTRLLSATSAKEMVDQHVEIPDKTLRTSCGLGWQRQDWNGHRVIGHSGQTIGQEAYLHILPDAGFAVVLLTNRTNSSRLYRHLLREIFATEVGVSMPAALAPHAAPLSVDLRRHLGRYERASVRYDIEECDGRLRMKQTMTGPHARWGMQDECWMFELLPYDASGDTFVFEYPPLKEYIGVEFYQLPTGERYLHLGYRATPKVG